MSELLKILDMTEKEQRKTIIWELSKPYTPTGEYENLSLADLAFRLRDEVAEKAEPLTKGQRFVWVHIHTSLYKLTPEKLHVRVLSNIETQFAFESWWRCVSKPIHWIIAALIAKETQ